MSDLLIVLLAWGPCENLKENVVAQEVGDQTSVLYVAPTSDTQNVVQIQTTTRDR